MLGLLLSFVFGKKRFQQCFRPPETSPFEGADCLGEIDHAPLRREIEQSQRVPVTRRPFL